eukprot:892428-Amphidinium_carterae.1
MSLSKSMCILALMREDYLDNGHQYPWDSFERCSGGILGAGPLLAHAAASSLGTSRHIKL